MLDLLSANSSISRVLLQNFVFKIVPVLNPDGVARGYWRTDCNSVNLNRKYQDPDLELFPTIFYTKKLVETEHLNQRLFAYADLHGHATKRGCFLFGNSISDSTKFVEQLLFAKLMSLNSVNFDYKECNFNDVDNNKKDLKGDSREGSGRASIYKLTGLPLCYTMEGNYAVGLRINTLQPRFSMTDGKRILKEDHPV